MKEANPEKGERSPGQRPNQIKVTAMFGSLPEARLPLQHPHQSLGNQPKDILLRNDVRTQTTAQSAIVTAPPVKERLQSHHQWDNNMDVNTPSKTEPKLEDSNTSPASQSWKCRCESIP